MNNRKENQESMNMELMKILDLLQEFKVKYDTKTVSAIIFEDGWGAAYAGENIDDGWLATALHDYDEKI